MGASHHPSAYSPMSYVFNSQLIGNNSHSSSRTHSQDRVCDVTGDSWCAVDNNRVSSQKTRSGLAVCSSGAFATLLRAAVVVSQPCSSSVPPSPNPPSPAPPSPSPGGCPGPHTSSNYSFPCATGCMYVRTKNEAACHVASYGCYACSSISSGCPDCK